MRRRRTRRRGVHSRFVRLLAGGALILWMGSILLAVLDYEAPVTPEPRANSASLPAFSSPPVADEQTQGRTAARDPKARSAAASRETPRTSVARGPAIRAVADREDQALATGAAQPPATDEPADSVTDIAQLETAPEAEPSISSPAKRDITADRVARAQFTTGIAGREPVNRVDTVLSMNGEVYSTDGRELSALYYFTELEGMRGETVMHRWEHEGETVAQASFEVNGDPWSVYSRQDLPPATGGEWRVVVTDAQGNVIRTDDFSYQNF